MLLATMMLASTVAASLRPVELKCEALVDPVGIGTAAPSLSWKLEATDRRARNLAQSAYRILVATDIRKLAAGRADLWDSGTVASSQTYGVVYAGEPLKSGQAAWWKVQVLDLRAQTSDWSAPASFSVGLLEPTDWKAEWIGFDAPIPPVKEGAFVGASWIWSADREKAVRHFRKTFTVGPNLTKATLHVTADDRYALSVNGSPVSQSDEGTDAWSRPKEADLTRALKAGENTFAVRAENTGGDAGLLVRLDLSYASGTKETVMSDSSWSVSEVEGGPGSPVVVIAPFGAAPWGKLTQGALRLPPPRLLRHEFSLAKPVRRAVLYGSALGLIELHLNGQRVSDELFVPGWTDYAKRVYARAYDVTKRLKAGPNALGAILGDGWYAGYVGYGGIREHYGKKPRALAQLEIEYADGTRQTITTSRDWRAATGPILESDFLQGEAYDARKERDGWTSPGASMAGWQRVDTGAEMSPAVEMFPGQPVRPYAELRAKRVTEPTKGTYILDLGQNMAGFARLRVKGEPGQKITLRFAERLNPDGSFYTANLRMARCVDTYVCRGGGTEVWEPRFTFHGFQYIEVTGLGRKPGPDEVVGIAISTDTPTVGTLETSDPMLNKLVSNAWWTQRMNFIDIPTDCPQRDERLGWTGDAQAYIRTACMLTDVHPFFTKWLVSLDDAQRADGQFPMVAPVKVAGSDGGPAWADAGVICPWTTYDVYGDRALLARHYPAMRKFVEFCRNRSTPDLLPPAQFHCFGDWLNINAPTPNEVIYSAYFAGSARLVSQAARALGLDDDAEVYGDLYTKVREAFNRAYVADDGVVKGDTQCGYVLALGFDLLDEPKRQIAADRLIADIEKRDGHLSTGFVGTRDIMHVLSKIGRNDVAFRLLHNTTFPSWGFTIVNGATSIWERWDGWTPDKGFQDPGMNSFAHYAFGAVVGWMFAQPAGIVNTEPGFGAVRIAPQIDPNLSWLRSRYDSIRGPVVSEWKVAKGRLTMKVVVPPNVRAEIVVPSRGPIRSVPSLSPRPVEGESATTVYDVGSGEYAFEAPYAP
ncbi:MAG: family 78 glycoside hydrolase catalytic domain [Fimbriimonadaceae bacterium]|nr:family 78 glycoside hydrolase catalytic domain [Fimbriimonadaceae bacterium]